MSNGRLYPAPVTGFPGQPDFYWDGVGGNITLKPRGPGVRLQLDNRGLRTDLSPELLYSSSSSSTTPVIFQEWTLPSGAVKNLATAQTTIIRPTGWLPDVVNEMSMLWSYPVGNPAQAWWNPQRPNLFVSAPTTRPLLSGNIFGQGYIVPNAATSGGIVGAICTAWAYNPMVPKDLRHWCVGALLADADSPTLVMYYLDAVPKGGVWRVQRQVSVAPPVAPGQWVETPLTAGGANTGLGHTATWPRKLSLEECDQAALYMLSQVTGPAALCLHDWEVLDPPGPETIPGFLVYYGDTPYDPPIAPSATTLPPALGTGADYVRPVGTFGIGYPRPYNGPHTWNMYWAPNDFPSNFPAITGVPATSTPNGFTVVLGGHRGGSGVYNQTFGGWSASSSFTSTISLAYRGLPAPSVNKRHQYNVFMLILRCQGNSVTAWCVSEGPIQVYTWTLASPPGPTEGHFDTLDRTAEYRSGGFTNILYDRVLTDSEVSQLIRWGRTRIQGGFYDTPTAFSS